MSMTPLVRAVGAGALFLFSSLALAAPADRIYRTTGGRAVVVDAVTSDQWDEVKYKKGANDLTFPGMTVRSIEYGDAPESYTVALQKRDAGEFENAVSLLKSAQSDGKVRPWIKVTAPFEIAKTYLAWGTKDKSKFDLAVKAFDEALAANAKTRLRPEILSGRAQANLGAGHLDAAVKDYEALEKEAYENKYGVRWELRALADKAAALDDGGKGDDAKREYSRLEKSARGFTGNAELDAADKAFAAEMAGIARLAQGRVMIRDNKAADAERFFDQIVKDTNEVAPVRASALTGKGEALHKLGKLKDAQLCFAQVRIKYASATDAVAEATYRLGLVCTDLGAAEPKGAKLAQDYFLEVVSRFGSSRWARLAQDKLR